MKLFSIVLGIASVQICTALLTVEDTIDASNFTCPKTLQVFGVRGASLENPPYGDLSTLIFNVTAKIKGSQATPSIYNKTKTMLPQHTKEGAAKLINLVGQFTELCPDTLYMIASYSEGAILMMDALCGYNFKGEHMPPLENKYAKNMIAATAYGDESWKANQPYDYSTCTTNGPVERPYRKCGAFRPLIRSYCLKADAFCCPKQGDSKPAHFIYPQIYDEALSNYLVKLYDERAGLTRRGNAGGAGSI